MIQEILETLYTQTAFCYPSRQLYIGDTLAEFAGLFDLAVQYDNYICPIQPGSYSIHDCLPGYELYQGFRLVSKGKSLPPLCPQCPKAFQCIDDNIEFLTNECEFKEKASSFLFKEYNIPILGRFTNEAYADFMSQLNVSNPTAKLGESMLKIISHVFFTSLIRKQSPNFDLLSDIINQSTDRTFSIFDLQNFELFDNTTLNKTTEIDLDDINFSLTTDSVYIHRRNKND